jgi:hypothetical protein
MLLEARLKEEIVDNERGPCLPQLVAHDEGFFRNETLWCRDFQRAAIGPARIRSSSAARRLFKRTLEAAYEDGECDQFRMCEWRIMKRAVKTNFRPGHRSAKIVALGSAMSGFAIVSDPQSGNYEPAQLKNTEVGVSLFTALTSQCSR